MHHDRKVTKHNELKKIAVKKAVKLHRRTPTAKTLLSVFSLLDKSVKTHNIHKNKAARLKSRLAKLVAAK